MADVCCRTRLYGMVCAAHGNHAVWMCLTCGNLVGHSDRAVLAVETQSWTERIQARHPTAARPG